MEYNNLGNCFKTLDANFLSCMAEIDEFMKKTLDWTQEMKVVLAKKAAESKPSRQRKKLQTQQLQAPNSLKEMKLGAQDHSVADVTDTEFILNDTLSNTRSSTRSRTRATIKKELPGISKTSVRPSRSRSRFEENDKTLDSVEVIVATGESIKIQKRSMRFEEQSSNSSSKRVKQEEAIFKKPPIRGKRRKKNNEQMEECCITDTEQNLDDLSFATSPKLSNILKSPKPMIYDSPKLAALFQSSPNPVNVIHSSPKKVATPSVKEKVAAFERLGSECGTGQKKVTKEKEEKRIVKKNSIEKRESNKVFSENEVTMKKRTPTEKKNNSTTLSKKKEKSDLENECCIVWQEIPGSKQLEGDSKKANSCGEKEARVVLTKVDRKDGSSDSVKIVSGKTSASPLSILIKDCKVELVRSDEKPKKQETIARSTRTKTKKENEVEVGSDGSSKEMRRTRTRLVIPEHIALKEKAADKSTEVLLLKPVDTKIKSPALSMEVIKIGSENSDTELEATFVVSKQSTRTKPVVKSKEQLKNGMDDKTQRKSLLDNIKQKSTACVYSDSEVDIVKQKLTATFHSDSEVEPIKHGNEENQEPVRKKRTKMRKKDEQQNNEDDPEGENVGRITRTKSKAAKKAAGENQTHTSGLSVLARKSLSKAKLTALKKLRTSQADAIQNMNLFSASKYQTLLSSIGKMKTPLSTVPKNTVKSNTHSKVLSLQSATKKEAENVLSTGKSKYICLYTQSTDKRRGRVDSTENFMKSSKKASKEDLSEKELKLLSKKEKEEEAAAKREQAIKKRQEELKRKNRMKREHAMKQREKLELEKHNNIVQSEKEKDEKHKQILQEREIKIKEDVQKKKLITQQKIAETEERRRLEEEARLAKLREQEAEQQRLMLEKQKELERQEKRAQERLAEKKAREQFQQQQKERQLELEKQLKMEKLAAEKAQQLQSANKKQKRGYPAEIKEWNYKSRNENDYGLEDENSEVDSGDDEPKRKDKPLPSWAEGVISSRGKIMESVTLAMLNDYICSYQKTPNIQKMFKMTPSKRIKRTSSAIWNTPRS